MNLSSDIDLFESVNIIDRLLFTKHLSIMLKSGIPLAEAVQIIKRQTEHRYFKKVLQSLERELSNGQPLHKALRLYPRVFDSVYLSLVKIGEDSGTLEENLGYLATQQRKGYDFKKKVQAALLYPAFILFTAVIVGGGISFFVMPKLVELFESLDVALPLSTKILLFVANFMKDYNVLVFGGFIIISIIFRFFISLNIVKPYWHHFLLSIPKIGTFLQNVELAHITRDLGIMLKSGLPIITSLEALEESMSNLVYKDMIGKVKNGVSQGKSIEHILTSLHTKFVPLIVTEMIGVGERTGKIEESLLYLGDFFEDEVDTTSKNLANLLEPVILLVIGIVVAFVALSIIAPIYQLTSGIKAR